MQLVCPSYGDAVSMRHFKFWVTQMYDVAVAVKLMRLDCLSYGIQRLWSIGVGHVNAGMIMLIDPVIFFMGIDRPVIFP